MFGKKDKKPELIGAKAKREMAIAQMQGDAGHIESKKEGKGGPDIAVPLVMIYGMALGLATLLMQGPLAKGGLSFRLPDGWWHALLLGQQPMSLTGDMDADLILAIFIRGTAIFLLAALVPLVVRGIAFALRIEKPKLYLFWLVNIVLLLAGLAVYVL